MRYLRRIRVLSGLLCNTAWSVLQAVYKRRTAGSIADIRVAAEEIVAACFLGCTVVVAACFLGRTVVVAIAIAARSAVAARSAFAARSAVVVT